MVAMVASGLADIQHGPVGGGHGRQSGKLAGLVTQAEAAKLLIELIELPMKI